MFKNIKKTIDGFIADQAHKVIGRAYVKQCKRMADGDDIKFRDYLMPSIEPICLFVNVDRVDKRGLVEDGEFVSVQTPHDESWILTFDDYVHAEEMATEYENATGFRPMPRKTVCASVFTQEAPVMGALCCKSDGTVIETHKSVYRTLIKAMYMKQKLQQARANELRKRMEQDGE
jgi:hypothetical protein